MGSAKARPFCRQRAATLPSYEQQWALLTQPRLGSFPVQLGNLGRRADLEMSPRLREQE